MFLIADDLCCAFLSIFMLYHFSIINQLAHVTTVTLKCDASYSVICTGVVRNMSTVNVHCSEVCLVRKMQLDACKTQLGEHLCCLMFVLRMVPVALTANSAMWYLREGTCQVAYPFCLRMSVLLSLLGDI